MISECGLKGITKEQVNMTYKFIEAHVVAQKIDLEYKMIIDAIKTEDSCHNGDGFKFFMNTFKAHIVTSDYFFSMRVKGSLL